MSQRGQELEQELVPVATSISTSTESGNVSERCIPIGPGPVARRPVSVVAAAAASASGSSFFPAPSLIKVLLLGTSECKQRILNMNPSGNLLSTVGIGYIEKWYANTKFQIWGVASVSKTRAPVSQGLSRVDASLIVPDSVETLHELYGLARAAQRPMFWMEVELAADTPRSSNWKEALNEAALKLPDLVKLTGASLEDLCLGIQGEMVGRAVTVSASKT